MKQTIGIDVSKKELVIYAFGQYFTIENESQAIVTFLQANKEALLSVDLVIFEATGGYERELRDCLCQGNYAYHVAHPNKVRAFGRAEGYLAKTDRLDAKVLALYGAQSRQAIAEKPLPSEGVQMLRRGLDRREQLIEERTREINRLKQTKNAWLQASIKRHIDFLNEELEQIEQALQAQEKAAPELKQTQELLASIPGVGKQLARTIMAYLPELNDCNAKSVAALVGVAPLNKDSGSQRGRRCIQAGRNSVRSVLYMGALTATRYNESIKVFYERLRKKGKPYKVALVAAMRKLLLMIQSVLRRGTPWIEKAV